MAYITLFTTIEEKLNEWYYDEAKSRVINELINKEDVPAHEAENMLRTGLLDQDIMEIVDMMSDEDFEMTSDGLRHWFEDLKSNGSKLLWKAWTLQGGTFIYNWIDFDDFDDFADTFLDKTGEFEIVLDGNAIIMTNLTEKGCCVDFFFPIRYEDGMEEQTYKSLWKAKYYRDFPEADTFEDHISEVEEDVYLSLIENSIDTSTPFKAWGRKYWFTSH